MSQVAERLRSGGNEVRTSVRGGTAALVILEEAASGQADLIVMSTHGHSGPGRFLWGSVADEVLRKSEVPILLIPPTCERQWPTDRTLRILVTLDGSTLAEEVLPVAADVAEALRGEMLLLRVVETESKGDLQGAEQYLERLAAGLRTEGRTVGARVVVGSAPTAITQVVQAEKTDMIAMATHGRVGLGRLVLGSVTAATLGATGVPLLAVRPATLRPSRP